MSRFSGWDTALGGATEQDRRTLSQLIVFACAARAEFVCRLLCAMLCAVSAPCCVPCCVRVHVVSVVRSARVCDCVGLTKNWEPFVFGPALACGRAPRHHYLPALASRCGSRALTVSTTLPTPISNLCVSPARRRPGTVCAAARGRGPAHHGQNTSTGVLQLLGHLVLELVAVNRVPAPAPRQTATDRSRDKAHYCDMSARAAAGAQGQGAGGDRVRKMRPHRPVPVGSPVWAMKSWMMRWKTTPL